MIKTSDLIDECDKRGFAVTPQRLYRWARDGLLPSPPARTSQGYKGGLDENLWDETCLNNIAVIMGASNQRISKRTVQHLIANGCWVSGKLLRGEMELCLDEWVDDTPNHITPDHIDVDDAEAYATKRFKHVSSELHGVVNAIKQALFIPFEWIHHPDIRELGTQRISEGDDNLNMDFDKNKPDERHWVIDFVSLFSIGSIQLILSEMTETELEQLFINAACFAPVLAEIVKIVDGGIAPELLPKYFKLVLDTSKLPSQPTARTAEDEFKIKYLAHITTLLMFLVWNKKQVEINKYWPKVVLGFVSGYFPEQLQQLWDEYSQNPNSIMNSLKFLKSK
jgi:hypothetical protein